MSAAQAATLSIAIAVVSLILAGLSLGWQAATFFLEGGRIRATLRPGFSSASGVVTVPPSQFLDKGTFGMMASQGFTQPVLAVQVRNVGRLPVTIASWSLVTRPHVGEFQPLSAALGKPLPHRLDAGESEMWAVDFAWIAAAVSASATVKKVPTAGIRVHATVSLGDGRVVAAKGRV